MKGLLLLVLTLVLALPERDDEYRNEVQGFRVDVPRGWTSVEEEAGGKFKLILRPEGNPGTVQAEVQVQAATDGETAELLQQKTLVFVTHGEAYSEVDELHARIADTDAPGVVVRFRAATGDDYRIRQHFVVANGMRYTLQLHAPLDGWDEPARVIDRAWRSFRLLSANDEALEKRRIVALAARCGSEISWAKTWKEAAARARAAKRPILVHVRIYPGFAISDSAMAGLYMDPDIVELVEERFVAWKFARGAGAPFEAQSIYGMSPTTFGQAMLVVSPDGEVLHETHATDPYAGYAFLLDALARHPEYPGEPPPDDVQGLDRADLLLRRGELDAAAALLEDADTARGLRLRASLARRRRDGAHALADLHAARELEDDPGIDVEEAVVLLALGREEDARSALERPLAAGVPEAVFWSGICDVCARHSKDAVATWRPLLAEHGDSRWAWLAAAIQESTGFDLDLGLHPAWPAEDALRSLRSPALESLELDETARAEREAVRFLLAEQTEDGSWISPSGLADLGDRPNPFVDAVTAICAASLLAREGDASRHAVEHALDFLLASHARAREVPELRLFMDYTVWSKAWVLWLLADCLDAKVGEASELRKVMGELVAELAAKQRSNGGWSYYVTGNVEDGGAGPEQSISFVTAPVVLALLRAEDAGGPVQPEVLDRALSCLERMRNEDGTFEYFEFASGTRGRPLGIAGATGRGPVCELALLRGGRSDVERVRGALDLFVKHADSLAKEVGKVLMHAGPDGQGCHYPMFDYAFAAEATREIPEEERARYRVRVLELVLDTRSVEGGYRDTPINGWAYGTGMALRVFAALE